MKNIFKLLRHKTAKVTVEDKVIVTQTDTRLGGILVRNFSSKNNKAKPIHLRRWIGF